MHLFKNLGVHITSNLIWKPHVEFYRKSLSTSLRIQLIKSLVLLHFDYASILVIGLEKSRTLELQTAHNSHIRFIFGNIPFISKSNVDTHLTNNRLQLDWLSLTSKRYFQLACLIYKRISNNNPKYLSDRLVLWQFSALTSRSIRLLARIFDY